MTPSRRTRVDRRRFLQISLGAGGALVIATCSGDAPQTTRPDGGVGTITPAPSEPSTDATDAPDATTSPDPAAPFRPNLFVSIAPDGAIGLTVHRSEMGQGVRTSLAMILAEELGVDLDQVTVERAGADEGFGSQVTSGSGSITDSFRPLRLAGAAARMTLVDAAARHWGADAASCRVERGEVIDGASGARIGYGDLVALVDTADGSGSPVLTDAEEFRIIGTSQPRVDGPDIVTGRLRYGIDLRIPDLRFAAVVRSPVPGGTLRSHVPDAALAVAGVEQVVEVPSGVAVVASSTWAAWRGRDAVVAEWDDGDLARWSTDTIRAAIADAIPAAGDDADSGAPADGGGRLEVTYDTPYLSHLPMEPMTCAAHVRDGRCEIWTSTQNPVGVRDAVAAALGLPVTVEVLHCGGGFGRRLEVDVAVEAAQVSAAVGVPVLVTFSRADDVRHDFPHAPTRHALSATWDASGELQTFAHHVAGPGLHGIAYTGGREVLQIEQAVPYRIAGVRDTATLVDIALPTGPWRGTFAWPSAYATECFVDEIAAALHEDPVTFRRRLLVDDDRLRNVLDLAVERSDWGSTASPGDGFGVACHTYHGTAVAMVASVTVSGGVVAVRRIVAALDCGTVVHPDMVVQQIEGGVAFGLTALSKRAPTHRDGVIEQQNFDELGLVTMAEMPLVEVHLVPSRERPTGVGEMAVPVVIPAVLNAVFAASGLRVRSLPLATV